MTAFFSNRHAAESARLCAASRYAPAVPMSAPPRPFLLRFTLALLGMLLLMAVVFAGLGWMVARDYGWVRDALGVGTADHLRHSYLVFMMNLMPGDMDGDGVCDGAELFLGTDPRNPTSYPPFIADCVSRPTIIAYCGERISTRWAQITIERGNGRWPRGFRAVVSSDEPVLLPKDGTELPTKGPLIVPVNERGEVEFDILAEHPFWQAHVDFGNAANNTSIGPVPARFPGWRTPPIPASINGGRPVAAIHRDAHTEWFTYKEGALEWVAPADWMGDYVIEAAREEDAGSWLPVRAMKSINSQWNFGSDPWRFFPGYTGPLKFRVVPVSPTPP